MFFADDIVLVAENTEKINRKLKEWRIVLESRGLRISRTKTNYLRCDFSRTSSPRELELTIGEEVVASTTKFNYLESIIQSNGEIHRDVNHRIQVGWLKWRAATGVPCDRKFPS